MCNTLRYQSSLPAIWRRFENTRPFSQTVCLLVAKKTYWPITSNNAGSTLRNRVLQTLKQNRPDTTVD